jgi:hypothetical protein
VELIQGGIELIPPLPLNPFGVISLNPLTPGNMFGKQGIIQGLRCGKIQQTEKKIDPYMLYKLKFLLQKIMQSLVMHTLQGI